MKEAESAHCAPVVFVFKINASIASDARLDRKLTFNVAFMVCLVFIGGK
jgi:hypothetical protein